MMNNKFQKVLAVALMTGFLTTSIGMGISEAAPKPHRNPAPAHHQQMRPPVHKVGPVHHAPAMHRHPAPPTKHHGPVVVRHRPAPVHHHYNNSHTMHGKDWARVAVAGGIIGAILANGK